MLLNQTKPKQTNTPFCTATYSDSHPPSHLPSATPDPPPDPRTPSLKTPASGSCDFSFSMILALCQLSNTQPVIQQPRGHCFDRVSFSLLKFLYLIFALTSYLVFQNFSWYLHLLSSFTILPKPSPCSVSLTIHCDRGRCTLALQ